MDAGSRFLILSLEGGSFAVPIERLLEIIVPTGLRKDANLTSVFEGKINYRGWMIPVVNAKKMLKLPGNPGSVLLVIKGSKGVVGILVDAVTQLLDSDQKPVPLPAGLMDPGLRYYAGILRHKGELIVLLDEEGLLQ